MNVQMEFARYDEAAFWNQVPWQSWYSPGNANGRGGNFMQGNASPSERALGAGRPGYYLNDTRRPASMIGLGQDDDTGDDDTGDDDTGASSSPDTSIPSGSAAAPAAAAGPSASSSASTSTSSSGATAAPAASSSSGSWFGDLMTNVGTAVKALAPAAASLQQQSALATLNAQRAKQGLPPLSSLPAVTANVGLTPATQSMLMYVAAGAGVLGLVYIFASGRGRGRR